MVMRGVEKESSQTVTSAMLGAFRENPQDARGISVPDPREVAQPVLGCARV